MGVSVSAIEGDNDIVGDHDGMVVGFLVGNRVGIVVWTLAEGSGDDGVRVGGIMGGLVGSGVFTVGEGVVTVFKSLQSNPLLPKIPP